MKKAKKKKAQRKLTYKEKIFVEKYIESKGDRRKSAMAAYHIGSKGGAKDGQGAQATASTIANKVLAKPPVINAIEERSKLVWEKLHQEASASVDTIVAVRDTAKKPEVKLAAAKDILDRTGFKPAEKVQVDPVIHIHTNIPRPQLEEVK